MKFAAKYEILEPVTRGSVETFVARCVATDERVLVHIFECPEQRSDQPTVQWVLESFQAVAPDPAELVLATGRYSGTSYAYLATKLPDSAVLQEWVRSYEDREEKKERAAFPERASVSAPEHEENPHLPASETDQSTVIRGLNQPKETTVIEGLRSNSNAPSETDDTPSAGRAEASRLSDTIIDFSGTDFRPAERVQQQNPGEFTGQFLGSENVSEEPAQPVPAGRPPKKEQPQSVGATDEVLGLIAEASTPAGIRSTNEAPSGVFPASTPGFAAPAESAGITDLLRFSNASQPQTSFETASSTPDDIKIGEFTGFFRGPFDGERSAQTPDLSPPLSQPNKQPGEFTEIFGKSEDAPSHGRHARERLVGDIPVRDDPAPLTHVLETADAGSKIPEIHEPSPQHTEIMEANSRKFPTFVEQPSPNGAGPPRRSLDSPAEPPVPKFGTGKSWRDGEPAIAFRSEADGATHVFSAPGRELVDGSATVQAGPSDFTRIISGGLMEPTPADEPPMPTGSRDDFVERLAAAPGISPLHSSLPAAPPPPQLQRLGHFPQMPAPPGIATPHAPTASRLGSAAPKPAGVPWKLIIIINGLVVLAVVLVLYFALKH